MVHVRWCLGLIRGQLGGFGCPETWGRGRRSANKRHVRTGTLCQLVCSGMNFASTNTNDTIINTS